MFQAEILLFDMRSQDILAKYEPRASVVPAALNLTDCPYAWPFCRQPLYADAMPVIFNATVLNGMGLTGLHLFCNNRLMSILNRDCCTAAELRGWAVPSATALILHMSCNKRQVACVCRQV